MLFKYRLRSVSKKHSHKTNLLDMSVRPLKRRKHCLGPHILTRNKSLRSIKDPESPPYVEWAPVPKSVLCQAWRRPSRSSVVLANTLRGLTFASPWVFFLPDMTVLTLHEPSRTRQGPSRGRYRQSRSYQGPLSSYRCPLRTRMFFF